VQDISIDTDTATLRKRAQHNPATLSQQNLSSKRVSFNAIATTTSSFESGASGVADGSK
jgi:hypothetical protein